MLKFHYDSPIDDVAYLEHLRNVGRVLIDRTVIHQTVKYERGRAETNRTLARRTFDAKSGYSYGDMGTKTIVDYLISFEGCPPNRFRVRGQESDSLNSKKVLLPLLEQGKAQEFITYYTTYKSVESKCNRMDKMLNLIRPCGLYDHRGVELNSLPFFVDPQQNLRFNYHDTDLISIPKEYGPAFAAEDGYFLAWGDFQQSDFRIAYNVLIRDEWNSKIMDKYTDKYEGMAAILAEYFGYAHDHDKFLAERGLYKLYVLQTIYGQRYGHTPAAQEFITKFAQYLETCPRYKEYLTRIELRYELQAPLVVTGYFGHSQVVPTLYGGSTEKEKQRNKTDAVNKALNTPVQTGTSQIVVLVCNAILQLFYDRGYTKDDASIYVVRHDEPVFRFSKRAMKDMWLLNEASTIVIDNWTPLRLDFTYGYNYLRPDSELTSDITELMDLHKDDITIYEPDSDGVDYWPVPATLELFVSHKIVGDTVIVALLSYSENKVDYVTISKDIVNTLGSLGDYIRNLVLSREEELFDLGYKGVLVYNKSHEELYQGDLLMFNFKDTIKKGKGIADTMSYYMAYRYAQKYGVDDYIYDDFIISSNEQTVLSAGGWGVF